MAQRIYKQPGSRGSERDDGMYDDAPNSLVGDGSEARDRLDTASQDTQSSINNIDRLLDDNNSSLSSTTNAERSVSSANLSKAETNPGSGNGVSSLASAAAETNAIPFNAEAGGRRRFSLRGLSARKKIGGGIVGFALGGGLLFGGIAAGPLQLIHLGQVLEHSYSKSESDSSDRTGKLLRYARAYKNKNVGYTRVGVLGAKVMGSAVDALAESGITYKTNFLNRVTSVEFDRSKLADTHPEVKNMTDTQFRSFVEANYAVSAESIAAVQSVSSGSAAAAKTYTMNADNLDFKALNQVNKTSLSLVGNGRITTFIKARVLKGFYGLGSIFHPFSRAVEQKINDAVNTRVAKTKESKAQATEEVTSQVEDTINTAETAPIEAEAQSSVSNIENEKSSLTSTLAKFGLGAAASACVVRSTANDIVKVNHYRIVVPAEAHALKVTAEGAQLMNPDMAGDVNDAQVGQAVKDTTDYFKSPEIQLLSGEQPAQYENDEMPNSYRQAFARSSTAQSIIDGVNSLFSDIPGGADAVCSPVTAVLAAAVAVGRDVAGALAAPETGGLSIAAAVGANSLLKIAETGVLLHFVTEFIVNQASDAKIPQKFYHSKAGGALTAFGIRNASNVASAAAGAIDLGNHASTLVGNTGKAQEQQFKSQSMFARVFDKNDYRSLTGRMADSISGSLTTNIATSVHTFNNIGGTFSSMVSSLVPRASADTKDNSYSGNFDWGFGQFGIPDFILNDPDMQNPYDNAGEVVTKLMSDCEDSGAIKTCPEITRAETCFGVMFNIDSAGVWDVKPDHEVDPQSQDYSDANCNPFDGKSDVNDKDWARMILFIFDTSTLKAAACYTGDDEQSCVDEGVDSTGSAGTNGITNGSGSAVNGDAATLAKLILADKKIMLAPSARADIEAAAAGNQVLPGAPGSAGATSACSSRVPTYLNATLLQGALNIAQNYSYQINDIVSGHACDTGRHPLGRAMDIFCVANPAYTQQSGLCGSQEPFDGHWDDKYVLKFASDTTKIMSDLQPKGKFVNGRPVNMSGIGVCSTGDVNAPSNINYFVDACDELHVDVGLAP